MKLPKGSVCLIIICLAGRALASCSTSVLECENLDLLTDKIIPSRHSLSVSCPLLPPLFSCMERLLSSCALSRNVYWMVRREVSKYICKEGRRAYLASVDCFERNDANTIVNKCEAMLQRNLVKHNACQLVDDFVVCAETELGERCGETAGCVMGNVGRAYVGAIKQLLPCAQSPTLTHCEAPEIPTTTPRPSTTPKTSTVLLTNTTTTTTRVTPSTTTSPPPTAPPQSTQTSAEPGKQTAVPLLPATEPAAIPEAESEDASHVSEVKAPESASPPQSRPWALLPWLGLAAAAALRLHSLEW